MVLFAGLQRYSIIQANLERSKAENGRDKTDKKLVNTGELNLIFHSSLVKRLLDGSFIVYLFDKLYNRLPPTWQCQIYLLKNNLIKEAKIFTHLTNAEKISLHKLARQLNFNSISVEIGSYLGASSCFLANSIKKNNGILYCIDTWKNQTMPEGERDTYAEFLKNTGKYKDIIILIRGWSSVSVNQLKTRTDKIDFLFIDGDHSYEGCKTDWDYYSPLLKKKSIVVFHDTGWSEGVNKLISESVITVADKILELPNMRAFRIN